MVDINKIIGLNTFLHAKTDGNGHISIHIIEDNGKYGEMSQN